MALREDLLDVVDEVRGIPGEMGLHRFEVYVERTVFTGARTGLGTPTQGTTTTTRLLVGGQNPKVRQLQQKDIIGGSDLKDVLYEIGPLTPEFFTGLSGGEAPSVIDPPTAGQSAQVYFILKGPGIQDANGIRCKRVSDDLAKPFRYTIHVKRVGRGAT